MWSDLDYLLLRESKLAPEEFQPGEETKTMLMEYARVLVVGAGGLGCEILKNLALSGFTDIEVIDLDRIDVTNLNRQFLFREKDVGNFKSEVAAKFIMERIPTCKVTPHTSPIQDFDQNFYSDFHIIIAGLDNLEARRWLNTMLHDLVRFDSNGEPLPETIRPLIDGGSEGFKGQSRIVIPYKTACYECTLALAAPQTSYPICTIAETPRIPEHCIQYAFVLEWPNHFERKPDTDSAEDMNWVFEKAKERAEAYGIEGVTYSITIGVVKNVIPAIASTNALIAAECCLEALKIGTYCGKPVENYFMYMGQTGINTMTSAMEKDPQCLVCSNKPSEVTFPRTSKLKELLEYLCSEEAKFRMKGPGISTDKGILYIPRPPSLEAKHSYKLELSFEELIQKGLYEMGSMLEVTDPTISTSLKINLILT